MDRVVQTSILMVLEAIYEPWFEKLNCSFGFRPRKGVHDAIYSLANNGSRGFFSAIEGDIKGPYDLVCKSTMISILKKTIKDRKFIDLISKRLDYEFFDTVKNKNVVEPLGVPPGGCSAEIRLIFGISTWLVSMSLFSLRQGKFSTDLTTNTDPLITVSVRDRLRPNDENWIGVEPLFDGWSGFLTDSPTRRTYQQYLPFFKRRASLVLRLIPRNSTALESSSRKLPETFALIKG